MRSRLILDGDVQGVGFRAVVKQQAQRAKIKGRVRNLEDGTVEIYCEYNNLEHLANFKDSLMKINTSSGLKVDKIEQFDEGSEQYGKIEEKYFKTFSVYYGDNLTEYEIDQADRSELTVFYGMKMLSSMDNGFSNLSGKMDVLGNKIDNVSDKIDNLGNKIDNVSDKIDTLGNKIDNVSDKIDNLGNKIDNVSDKIDTLGNKIDNVSDKIDTLGNKIDNVGEKVESMHIDMNKNFAELGNKIDNVSDKIDTFGNKIDNVGEKVESMHIDMNKNFAELDVKYGTIGEAMVKLLEQQQEHNKKLDEILKTLTEKK